MVGRQQTTQKSRVYRFFFPTTLRDELTAMGILVVIAVVFVIPAIVLDKVYVCIVY